jgi:uncharacterized protein YjbJ (UPF0337 family)
MKIDNTNKHNTESFTVTGDWAKQTSQLKETFPQLTDADLTFETGREHDLLTRVQDRLRKNRDEVIDLLRRGHVPATLAIG